MAEHLCCVSQAPSFYWEVEICPFGDSPDDSASFFSFGFMPNVEKRDGTWTYPVGSCLLHKYFVSNRRHIYSERLFPEHFALLVLTDLIVVGFTGIFLVCYVCLN